MSLSDRVKLASSCRDCDTIPKVEKAGKIFIENDIKVQYMFNGIKIYYDSYHSPWMNEIICNLNGHHEPQEELCFYHLLHLLDDDSNMLELGCAWAYYSMFFKNKCNNGLNVCIEPNIIKLNKGIENIKINKFDMSKFIFIHGFIGSNYKEQDIFVDWDKTEMNISQYNIEKIINNTNIFFDIIHSDIQGAELDMLKGSKNVLDKIGFFVISTHGDYHNLCLKYLEENDFLILIQHTISESVSADGLIISVNKKYISKYDKNLDISLNDYFNKINITRHKN
jgi:FkbM family methyltransferase